MNAETRNKWRNAVVSYNGRGYVRPVESLMRNTWKKMSSNERERWTKTFQNQSKVDVETKEIPRSLLDNWEFKRVFFIKQHLRNSTISEKVVKNLAHVESITGREVSEEFAESAICQWVQFEKENKNLSCK